MQANATVEHVGSVHEIVDSVQDDRALGAPDNLLLVGKEPPHGNSPSRDEPAEAVRQPVGEGADVVIGLNPAVQGGDHEVAVFSGLGAQTARCEDRPRAGKYGPECSLPSPVRR